MGDQEMILLLSKRTPKSASLPSCTISRFRFSERGFSAKEFRLSMTRGDIGNYLGLTVETISRLLGRFQKSGLISVKGKYITVLDNVALGVMAGTTRPPAVNPRLFPFAGSDHPEI